MVNFQLDEISISKKSDYGFGKQLAEYIQSLVNGGTSSYFFVRNQRWKTNRNYANGRINMSKFQDLLEFNGKVNYANLNWQCIHIVNRIVSGLVGRWMAKSEKISVTATDTLSTKKKQEEYDRLEFFINNKRQLQKLEQEAGIQILPQDDKLPADQDELNLWQSQFQRLPEEILYELGINDTLAANGLYDVLKEKLLHDSVETGFVGTYTWMDAEGVVHVEWLKPENCFYSYSNYPDFRDTSWRGYMRTMKISELRKKYSKEFNPNNPHAISEEKLFEISKTAKEYQRYDNITWMNEWNVSYLRPYDEWNIDVIEFELKTVDTESYTIVKTKKNGSTIIKKGSPQNKRDNEEVVSDSQINIYRGVYAISTQTMLEWGLKKNMIRPQDPKEIGNAEFSYSFYLVQNYDMTSLAVPEKIQEAADQMIIARLKIQQLVAKMRPIGSAVNWDALQNIDYGLGEANKSIDVKKLYDQTGDLYWRGKDAEGNQIPVPIVELQNAGFYNQLRGLIELYQFHYGVMKDELGEDPNLMSAAIQPRVTGENVEASLQQSEFATDTYYRAYVNVIQDTAKKVSCLLHTSVKHGSKVYRNIVGDEDLSNIIFSTKIQLLPDAFAIQKFEALMNESIRANGELLMFVDPFQLTRIAKEDVKLAETLFRRGQKNMLLNQQKVAAENQKATFEAQVASAKASEEEKRITEREIGDIEIKKSQINADAGNKSKVLELVSNLLKPSSEGVAGTIPPDLKPLVDAVVENIMVSAVAQTDEQKAKIIEQIAQARMAEQQQQQPEQEEPQVAA